VCECIVYVTERERERERLYVSLPVAGEWTKKEGEGERLTGCVYDESE
jgi:hypothetical protein